MPKIKLISEKKKVFTFNQIQIFPIHAENQGGLCRLTQYPPMHFSLLFLPGTEFNLNKDILSHNNVPLEKPKCTSRGTCTPVWEPLS